MPSQHEKMLSGALYDPRDPELFKARLRARELLAKYNRALAGKPGKRRRLLQKLLGHVGNDAQIEPPFHCDYGRQIALGDGCFVNMNCVILDVAAVHIGERTLIGPAVQIYAATHPLAAAARREGLELGRGINIGDDVWIGGGAIICPGVTIGSGAVIAAGSVVAADVAPGMLVAGNPARQLRSLEA